MSGIQWIEILYNKATGIPAAAQTSESSESTILSGPVEVVAVDSFSINSTLTSSHHTKAVKTFIATHFEQQGSEASYQYQHKATSHLFSEDQLISLIQIIINRHYDGVLHTKDYTGTKNSSWLLEIAKNLYPKSLFLQLVTLLECTSIFSALWEKDEAFNPLKTPNYLLFAAVAIFAYASICNIHYYGSTLNGLSEANIHALHDAMDAEEKAFADELNALALPAEVITTLRSELTEPSLFSRIEQDARSILSYFIKLSASSAVFFAELAKMPFAAQLSAAAIGGTTQGIDFSFTQVAIGNMNRRLRDFKQGTLSPSNVERGLIFPKIANFPAIPWLMAKVGPAMWTAIKTRAAFIFMELVGVTGKEVPGGLYGIYAIAALSSAYIAMIFSRFNIDEKLGRELPTIRTFQYDDDAPLRTAQGILGAFPITAAALYAAYTARLEFAEIAGIGASAQVIFTLAIGSSKRFADLYRYAIEMRFVQDLVNQFDRLHTIDKVMITLIGALLFGGGIGLDIRHGIGTRADYQVMAGIGTAMVYFGATGLFAEYSRSLASQIRFIPGQMLLYATALLTWVLNCAISFSNVAHNESPKNRPGVIDQGYFKLSGYMLLFILSLIAGLFAGAKDHAANATRVTDDQGQRLSDSFPDVQKRSSYVTSAIKAGINLVTSAASFFSTKCCPDKQESNELTRGLTPPPSEQSDSIDSRHLTV